MSGLAVVATRPSPDDPLAALDVVDAPEVKPLDGDTVVPVRAAALNHHDLWALRGVGAALESFPCVLGNDGAGDGYVLYPVIGCGETDACYGCRVGDQSLCRRLTVIGEGRPGTMAPEVALPAGNVVPSPVTLTTAESACLPAAYMTAYNMLFRASQPEPGDTVMVTGATGGLGVAALQLGSAAGFRMVAQVRRPEVAPALEALGAEAVITTEDNPKRMIGREVDVVIESVGEATWGTSLRSLRSGGTIVVAGATSGANPPADLQRVFWRQIRIAGASLGSLHDFESLVKFVDDKGVKPHIAGMYHVTEARAAFEHLYRGGPIGKVVLEFD